MDLKNLSRVLEGEPKYRLRQIKDYLFQKLIEDWKEATTLPVELRNKLNRECPPSIKTEIFPRDTDLVRKLRPPVVNWSMDIQRASGVLTDWR